MRYYGRWAGKPYGTKEDKERCVVAVWEGDFYYYQCSRKRGHGRGPNGEYCKQHARMLEEGKCVSVPKDEKG